ncbi:ABC transporter substrate-binding protein [Dongia rigui]|uniref:ABC transporter substrate-binding protein n=1 Tax=Dongia rigui TaxID=940149 RepID=A0ABU5E1D8_9PROT|nr:ABC transporter substrate-binding protein [Dongia rigui]MDY0873371.1 ABC transporter substrate-binding protein [Dongia rigui]
MSILRVSRRQALVMIGAAAALRPSLSLAQGAEPVDLVKAFYATLLDCMQHGAELGFDGRYQKIEPVLNNTFDVATMCKIAVGPEWTKMSGEKKGAVLVTFNKYMVTTYAARFKSFKNQKFEVGEATPAGDSRTLVESKLIRSNGEPVALNYLFRFNQNVWRVIDIYLSGSISQMAQMRSDFSKVVVDGGPDALIASLEQKIEDLKKEA